VFRISSTISPSSKPTQSTSADANKLAASSQRRTSAVKHAYRFGYKADKLTGVFQKNGINHCRKRQRGSADKRRADPSTGSGRRPPTHASLRGRRDSRWCVNELRLASVSGGFETTRVATTPTSMSPINRGKSLYTTAASRATVRPA